MRLPITFARDEVERLHSIAYAAAIQTGAKGIELDEVTSGIFRALAEQANRSVLRAREQPKLRVVEA
ncbi:MAG: hypothetical protein J0I69_03305 [Altererythrobacter sp.]|nr:hypothetical protein [Altererythrobacter sp.]OJU61024.1 MAG: hypothetical protein BGO08_13025 [Altererythrobacter sp. 66-12]